IYHLDYVTPLMTAVASVNLGSNAVVNALQWEKDGSYLAIGCRNESSGTAALQTYKFTAYCTASGGGFDFTKISTADFGGSAAYVRTLAWSPDNNFIVAGGYSGGTSDDYEVKLYAVAEGMLSRLSDGNIDFGATASGAYVSSLAWDPNQEYVLVGGYLYENSRQFRLYKFDGSSLVVKQGSQHTFGTNASSYVAALAWQPARTFVVVGGYLPSNSKELWLMEFVAA
ncbi:hypothetical protein FJ364_01075, partial [Candidatus Dependentiae bacterium]|nr:hypothetical protein [Candidatus Dependentiae bacterium]